MLTQYWPLRFYFPVLTIEKTGNHNLPYKSYLLICLIELLSNVVKFLTLSVLKNMQLSIKISWMIKLRFRIKYLYLFSLNFLIDVDYFRFYQQSLKL